MDVLYQGNNIVEKIFYGEIHCHKNLKTPLGVFSAALSRETILVSF